MTFFQKLKQKWGVTSNLQFLLINLSFAITGSLTVYIRKPVFSFLGIPADMPFIYKALIYISTVTPSYFIMLIIVGTALGQFKFFWAFEKRVLQRFKSKKTLQ